MSSPFSVLMSTYHLEKPELLDRALESIFSNDLVPEQVVLVIDGPIGLELRSVVDRYRSFPSLDVIELERNVGLAKALNIGLSSVRNVFTLRCDSDDFNLPFRFRKQMLVLDSGFDLVGSQIFEFDNFGNCLGSRRVPLGSVEIRNFCLRRNPFNHMTVGFRTDKARILGGYPLIPFKEDYGLWLKFIASNFEFMNVSNVWVHATTGDQFFRRRSGFAVISSEFDLQKLSYDLKLKSFFRAGLDFFSRVLILSLPFSLKKFLYRVLFRD